MIALVFATFLLAMPTQAQPLAKKSKAMTGWFVTHKPLTLETFKAKKAAKVYKQLSVSGNTQDVETNYVEVPYTNALNTQALFNEFTVIDANNDDRTWSFNESYEMAQYSYHSTNAGDDWLISPAIMLEGGKFYEFSIDGYGSSYYPERLEVMMGTAAEASAMTQRVLEPIILNWGSPAKTMENKDVFVAETGYYYFGIHAISDEDQGSLRVSNFVVKPGKIATAPAAVTDLNVVAGEDKLEATLTFTAPTKTLGGDDLKSLTKIEILRDGNVINTLDGELTPGESYTYVDNDENLTVGNHKYQVVAYNEDGKGDVSEEKNVLIVTVIELPYVADFSEQGTFDLFTIIDANEDGNTWNWNAANNAYYSYHRTNPGDDYLVTLPIHMLKGKNYKVSVAAYAASSNDPEQFEVVLGKQPTAESLTTTILPATTLTSTTIKDYDGEDFQVEEDGNYYVAVHCISLPFKWKLSISKLSVLLGSEPTVPAAVTDFTAAAGEEGALEVNLAFTAPITTKNGDVVDETMKIDVYRDDEVVNTFENVAYGEKLTWQDKNVENAKKYTYQIVTSSADGVGDASEKLSVFVGTDVPGYLKGLTATDNGSSINFNWQLVGNVGLNGGYVDPAKVNYEVWSLAMEQSEDEGSYLVLDEEQAVVTNDDNYQLDYDTEYGKQAYKYWGVIPANETGAGEGQYVKMLVGASYTLPFTENFKGGALNYFWDYSDLAGLFTINNASDGDGYAVQLTKTMMPGTASIYSGKLKLSNAMNPTLLFDVKSETLTKLNVLGSVDGGEYAAIQEDAPVTNEYTTVRVPLNNLKNGRYAQIGFSAEITVPTTQDYDYETQESDYKFGDMLTLDNIRIIDFYEYDLSAAVEAEPSMVLGEKSTVYVTVKNEGANAAEGYTVKVKAGEKELLNKTVDEVLNPFCSKEFTAELETSVLDEAGELAITAEVVFDNDLNDENNIAVTKISVKETTVTAPENLTGKYLGEAGIELNWDAPANEVEAVVEDFDDQTVFEPFKLGGVSARKHNGAFGDWTVYDGNGIHVFGFENGASYENVGAVQAWQPFNPTKAGGNFKNYAPHSGSQFLWSFCPADKDEQGNTLLPNADHWLISPELPGDAQTISFYAKQLSSVTPGASSYYGLETFEVLASSTDNKPESFTKVYDGKITEANWAEFTTELPVGSKFFAIRHTSKDIFGLLIDDIAYTTAGGGVPVAYNVYYEGEKIATVEGDKTTYTTAAQNVTEGELTFGVSAVYVTGKESKPAIVSVSVSTGINELSADGKPVDVYSLDGKLVRSQVKSLAGLKGVYVINGKTVMVK